jgi:hypothetical protein
MGTYSSTFPTDGNNIPGEGVFDQSGQSNVLKEGYGPTTAGAAGTSQAIAVGIKVSATNVSISSPSLPANTNAGTDTTITFASQVKRWSLQNNSPSNLTYNMDTAATLGSFVLVPGGQVWWDWPVTAVHVLTPSAVPINSTSAGGGLMLIGRAY